MSAEVLVMCPQCGRPQRSAAACVNCGAALPTATDAPRSARDALLDAYSPFLEGDVGGGRKLLLSEKRLEWTGEPSLRVDLSDLTRVQLTARPVYEALVFCLLAGGVSAFVSLGPRVALGVLFALGLAACFLQRRYALVLTRKDGESAELFWGITRPGSAQGRRFASVFDSVRTELKERKVEVAP